MFSTFNVFKTLAVLFSVVQSTMYTLHSDAPAGNKSNLKMLKKWVFGAKNGIFSPKKGPKMMKTAISHKFPVFGG